MKPSRHGGWRVFSEFSQSFPRLRSKYGFMMKPSSVATAILCGILCLSDCLLAAKIVAFSVTRALPKDGEVSMASLLRRGYVGEPLYNNVSFGGYLASVQVGTAAQTLMLQLGTGSSDVWVIDQLCSICKSSEGCITPFYPNKSQTISTVAAGGFDISYLDGTEAKGDYIKDEFAVGSTSSYASAGQARILLQMGLVTDTTINAGIMGIGYDNNEAVTNKSKQYQNFMDEMVRNDLTNTKLYSLWLNDLDSSTGSILFGGIDTEKYYGTLYSMPIHPDSTGQYTAFTVYLTSISFTPQAGSAVPITNSSFTTPVVLESSTTLIYLPDAIVDNIYSQFNVSVINSGGNIYPYIDCKYSNSSYMSFGFESGSVINVPYTEIINKLGVPSRPPTTLGFSDVCIMGILGGGKGPYLLGDFFLRSAYAVFDLTNNRIGIAQSNLNSTTSNIVEIPSGAASIPQSTGVALPNPTTSSTPISSLTSATGTSTSSSLAQTNASPKSNHAVAIGVGVAVPVVVILAAFAGICFWWRRRRAAAEPAIVPELSGSSYNAGPIYASMKGNTEGSEEHDNTAGRISQMSDPSELSSNPTPSSPRNARSTIERKPLPTTVEGLPTY